jgi:nitrogen fixation/metabolism regulation signal transduction histidine kinase
MGANAETLPKPTGGAPQRRLRNYLLDPRFQLKYTGMVVVVTVAVAAVLGYFAYNFSKGQTEILNIQIAMQSEHMDPSSVAALEGYAQSQDQQVLLGIIGGILVLALTLGITGIMVTHKLVGPAYKMRMLLGEVAAGKLRIAGRLRKGDELQELFEAFSQMIDALREEQSREIVELDEAIAKARAAGVADDALRHVVEVRNRMQAALD